VCVCVCVSGVGVVSPSLHAGNPPGRARGQRAPSVRLGWAAIPKEGERGLGGKRERKRREGTERLDLGFEIRE